MINTDALTRFKKHYADFDNAVQLHDFAFRRNVNIYLGLKDRLYNMDVSTDNGFRSDYSKFYGLNRYLNTEQKDAYFNKLEDLKKVHSLNINVSALTEEMLPHLGNKYHFSFCSKMANILNDDIYPIYDRNVRSSFHRCGLGYGKQYYSSIYHDIIDTYESLRENPVIDKFKVRYDAQNMGFMKVVDVLFWVLYNA